MLRKWEYRYIVAAIYTIVLFLDRLDLTIVNIALPAIARHFKVPITATEWLNNGFLLALTLSIPISAWLGERFGDKRIFVIAIGLFGIASLCCGLAPNLSFMIGMRFLQGLAGGMIVPVGMGMVFRVFEPTEYVSISSFMFMPTLIAPALAPALGGMMIYYFNWTWVFLFAVPICVVTAIVSILFLQENKMTRVLPLDWLGFILASVTLSLILYVLSALGTEGLHQRNLAALVIAGFTGYAFFKHAQWSRAPLIDMGFFQKRLFVQANLIQLTFQICHFGAIFLVGIYLQLGVGMTAMQAGIVMGMQALGSICISRFSVKLFDNYGPKLPIMLSFAGVGLLSTAILCIDKDSSLLLGFAILFVRGLFSGLSGAPLQTISILGFKTAELTRAGAIFSIGRQISISLGIALTSLLLGFGFSLCGIDLTHSGPLPHKTMFFAAFALLPISALCGMLITRNLDNAQIKKLGQPINPAA